MLIVIMAAGPAAPLWAQEGGSGEVVAAVEFVGLSATSAAYAREIAGVKVGDTATPALLDGAVAKLIRTGRFLTARHMIKPEEGGVRVTFEVSERRAISRIGYSGLNRYSESKAGKELAVKVGTAVDHFAIRDGIESLRAKYRDDGFGAVEITYDRAKVDTTGELEIVITEGRRVRVTKINFVGNQTYPRGELMSEIETRTAFWFMRSGALDEEQLQRDVARLRKYHRDQGFLDATVEAAKEEIDDSGDLIVTFTINEGARYTVEDVQWAGQTVFSADELRGMMKTQVGKVLRQPELDADVRTITDRYGEIGHIYGQVRAERAYSDTPGQVRLTINIKEGEQFKVGRVVVRGNSRTKDKVVRRELNMYPPDDLFNLPEAREAERRLLDTRIFGAAKVVPVGEEPGVRDAVIDVTESEKWGDFIYGVGVTSNSGVVGTLTLDLQNFDLYDTPRTLAELFKFKSFYGGGQRLRMELQPGTEVTRGRIDFTEPYLFDKPIRFDSSLFYFTRDRDGYAETRAGASVSLGKRFQRGLLRGWSSEVALQTELVTVDDLDLFAARDIREAEGDHYQSSIKGSLVRDRTDNRFLPSTGDRFRVSYEQFGILGGDGTFGKAGASYNWYKTLHTDLLERKTILTLRAEGGIVVGDAPVYERYYAGGVGSIRGFEFRGVGERQGLEDNNIGGDYLILMGAEYSYPLYGDNLRGHVFIDTGTAGSGAYRAAVGIGIRLTLNLIGPLPLEFNLAAPIGSGDGDDEQVFSFVVGGLF